MAETQVKLDITKNTDLKSLKKDPEEIPTFKTKIKLKEDQKERIWKEIDAELSAIDKERKEENIESFCDSMDRQYDGEMAEVENMQFNVVVKTTAVKINAIVRAAVEAFFESDHVFSASPRPGSDANGGREAAEVQEDFLDYKVDEVIPLEEEMRLVFHSAALKKGGVLKLAMKHKRKKRKASEFYEGGKKGLDAFITAYPDALTKYPAYVKALSEGNSLDLIVQYEEVVYDDPLPQYVDLKNFWCRKGTNGLDGLRDAYCVAERKEYTYWELKQEEKEERLYDVDKLTYDCDSDGKPKKNEKGEDKRIENYANEIYELFEVVFYTKIEGEGDDYVRCVFYISRDKKTMHGSDYYPYWGVDTYWIPFYVKKKKKGFYQPGIGEDLTDSNLAQTMFLNFMLQGAYSSNLITPIVRKGSAIAKQFIEKRWTHGVPLELDSKADMPDFLNKYFKPSNTPEMMNLITFLQQGDGNISGVSDAWATGKADPLDPSAPAMKTRDLLQQSGINIKDYIKCLGMSFNEVGNVLMQMYYQRNHRELKYRIPEEKIVGSQEFGIISRDQMAAKTNFQTMATIFDIDKLNAKKEDMALYQILRAEPLITANEEAVYSLVRQIVKGWSPKWKNNINKILPPLQVFKQQRLAVAVEAIKAYMQELAVNKGVQGGAEQVVDPKQLLMVMSTYLKEMATAPSKEQVQAREKEQASA